ncbi:MAG: Gfo/Idh/MocA family oxidoreductase [Ignavibacteriaceae bacterium]|jgi:UDP-N-acetyl-2-amino-2-deoxyglucuronate dehydrogenase|nr:Gfo/Idh/MocA family oxidoreductase [Ignavibacteriaceae bacterium]
MKNFALTGVAGYIAPRHLQAIKDTGNRLVAAMDPHDSVGILDKFFAKTSFFTEFERFDRHLEKLRRTHSDEKIDYLSICSPNNLHDAHIRLALRVGADAICEKPLVLNPWNLDQLQEIEKETGKKVFTVLQLRVHPALIAIKEKMEKNTSENKHNVVLTYITSRGLWYNFSWKGREDISGGVATNIGIHLFDLLMWLFGEVKQNFLFLKSSNKAAGFIELKNANVKWYLSIDSKDLPNEAIIKNKSTHRSITIDGNELEFTDGFTDLHTKIYEEILLGKGFGIETARASIETAYTIRHLSVSNIKELYHPMLIK